MAIFSPLKHRKENYFDMENKMNELLDNLGELNDLKSQYLSTLDSKSKEERYLSQRDAEEEGISNFIDWLSRRRDQSETDPVSVVVDVTDGAGLPYPGALFAIEQSPELMPEIGIVVGVNGSIGLQLKPGKYKFAAHGDNASGRCAVEVVRPSNGSAFHCKIQVMT